ncbi:hypothetical protein DFH08DRAFT_966168 [Mycena albidolilacea]|uniref:Uncharacterized protein n=1 Tax=Mycena albidolilacea TaxID=1033008 RepID=A0AAD6ZPH3_9AGAR|nr:hypothetical protein DFH08DRAFT_966168 [Mycena albidolilacea]
MRSLPDSSRPHFASSVARYWGTRMTWGTGFFYLNRYSALFGAVPILAEVLVTTTDPRKAGMCAAFQEYHKYFALLSLIFVTSALQLPLSDCAVMLTEVILIIRTYALYERSKHVLAFMIVVIFAAAAFALTSCFIDNLLLRRGS